ncbi:MAG TPA: alkaline phosphatase D family protein [Lacunisphaera sp.]|nr:alkaline phosphatase D family protein [Lacunisphaera sp.]
MSSVPAPLQCSFPVNRRAFLLGGAALAAAAILPVRARGAARLSAYPFTLGVASGDPAADGFVLWTRLAPRPLEPDGGMSHASVEVAWEIAADEGMTRVVRRGVATAISAWAHSVHVEVEGLEPDRWYWYRFMAGGEVSPTGRTRTLPAVGALPERLRFAFASCQKYEIGYFTAYEHMVREDIDLVLFLGDYIYENIDGADAVRAHGLPPAFTLDDYRLRYAVYKTDTALQAAHAVAPWIVTWDDHEVSNDYAGEVAEHPGPGDPARFLLRRAAAYRAYYEHMPLRRTALPVGSDLRLYRRFDYGRLARFNVLDTRQYRTDQPAGPRLQTVSPALQDPAGTMLGPHQLAWLFEGLDHSPAQWNVLAQQVLMAPVDRVPGPDEVVDVDKWAGYEFERRRLLRHFHEKNIPNPVVLTGDKHNNWANELLIDFDDSAERPVGVEFLGTSITSGGDGVDQPDYAAALLAENPFVKYHNNERGYVRCEITKKSWRSDFRTIPYVTRRGAPLQTRASLVVESGTPRLLKT